MTYEPHARIGRILARGGYATGPVDHVSPFFKLHDRDGRYRGWCKATTIDDMTRAGILAARPQGADRVTRNDVTVDFRPDFERMVAGRP